MREREKERERDRDREERERTEETLTYVVLNSNNSLPTPVKCTYMLVSNFIDIWLLLMLCVERGVSVKERESVRIRILGLFSD